MLWGRSFRRLVLAVSVAAVAAMAMAAGAQAQAYNAATQSHFGACSQNTVSVPHAVKDLNANGVLSQYAQMIGVHWKQGHLARAMRRALAVGHVKNTVVTANHGCTTQGLIFSVGPRTLHAGETVGVRLPKKYVGRACPVSSHKGCKRLVVKRAVVFPTNCWNVNFGAVRVAIYVKPKKKKAKPKPKPAPKVAAPSASATLTCTPANTNFGTVPGGGAISVTLSNGAKATATASFSVSATGTSISSASGGYGPTSFGPLSAGKSLTEPIQVTQTNGTTISLTVTSSGKTILSVTWPGGCPQFAGE